MMRDHCILDQPVLYISAEYTDSGAAFLLENSGFYVVPWPVYQAEAVNTLTLPVLEALRTRKINAALFFSARTGQTFTKLIKEAHMEASCCELHAIAISMAAAETIEELPWQELTAADRPDLESVLTCLSHAYF